MTQLTLADGVELMGEFRDSGYTEPHYLLSRCDGQVMQVPRLLHLVLDSVRETSDPDRIAERVSAAFGRTLTTESLLYLVSQKLQPMGLVSVEDQPADSAVGPTTPIPTGSPIPPRTAHDSSRPSAPPGSPRRAKPAPEAQRSRLLELRFRLVIVPAFVTRILARALSPLFWPPVVALALVAFIGMDSYLLVTANPREVISAIYLNPQLILVIMLLDLAATVFHELGHATGCRYSGAKPGRIGAGLYIVYPAFFTDVTQSYRLNRAGRLRTDLGGVYFNALACLLLGVLYTRTHAPELLLVMVLIHGDALTQLLPFVRLDGYFVLSDLVGVPDLFSRMGPVVGALRPGAPAHPAVTSLRPKARRVIQIWTLVTIPVLASALALVLWSTPILVSETITSMAREGTTFLAALAALDPVGAIVSGSSLLLLPLPILGVGILVFSLGRRLVVWLIGRLRERAPRRALTATPETTAPGPVAGRTPHGTVQPAPQA